jgi:hypothetical protein
VSAIKLKLSSTKQKSQPAIPPALVFFGIVMCVGCAWLGLQVAGPLEQAARLHSENDGLERTLRLAEIHNQDAVKQAHALNTDEGVVAAAREKGYMFPRERPLHVQSESAPAQSEPGYSANGKETRRPSSEEQ